MTPHVLVIGTSTTYVTLLRFRLARATPVDVQHVRTGDVGLRAVREETCLVVVDLQLPGENGLDTVDRLRSQHEALPVVLLTTTDQRSVLSEALGRGASEVVMRGRNDLDQLEWWLQQSQSEGTGAIVPPTGDTLVADSPAMERVFRMVEKVLNSTLSVALLGESGTGKERVATVIHERSNRADGPFVAVNCAAIPHELAESVFFGHEKGSFTGAEAQQKGHFERADGGTLFLDEIGELDPGLQAKLLRALQNREVQRVGSSTPIAFDARILCATNADMQAMLEAGTFREDLYYRLFQFPIRLPPLRERGQDILTLARHFLQQEAMQTTDAPLSFTTDARQAMLRYDWPGNVRELETSVQRALLLADGPAITTADLFPNRREPDAPESEPALPSARPTRSLFDLPEEAASPASTSSAVSPEPPAPGASAPGASAPASSVPASSAPAETVSADSAGSTSQQHSASEESAVAAQAVQDARTTEDIMPLHDLKMLAARRAVEICGGNVKQAAEALGIARSTVYRLLNDG
jgi:DNA-binding NtrC family response regulator